MEQRWLPVTNPPKGLAERETAAMPSVVSQAGDAARFAFEEFFYGQIRNPHTRKAYLHALRVFSNWCQSGGIELVKVTPGHVGRYLDALDVAVPTRKVHLAALRGSLMNSSCGTSSFSIRPCRCAPSGIKPSRERRPKSPLSTRGGC